MTCPRCRRDNPAAARFCSDCGARLAARCPGCGAPNPLAHRFCGECGAPLGAASGPARAPDAYTPRHLAAKILGSRAALAGERKHVTVLFADMQGSMALLAERDPEEARQLLDPILEQMLEAVHRYEGTVNQVMGDGIMALFGAPVAHEDHAIRGCFAALRLQEAVRRYSGGVLRSHGARIQVRVGLNSGEVIVRSIGTDLRMDYSAVGQTTHLAARMEQMAAPGSILITPETRRLAEGYVQTTPLGPVAVRGLPEAMEVFELTGASPVRSRLQAAAARGLSRFVGRDAELDQLGAALDLAARGRGQLVALVGEPGVGKSRAVHELVHSPRTQGFLVLESSAVSYGTATSYLPVVELLRHYFRIASEDDAGALRDKVAARLTALDRTLGAEGPALLALLDVPATGDEGWAALDPPERRRRTLEAVKRLILGESRVQPVLVIVEDLHWVDGETQALLDSLVDSLLAARVLLLVTYRPEYTHGWGSKSSYTRIGLDALLPAGAGAMLDALLGEDATVAPLRTLVLERAGGNPLFVEETVRTLVETGALEGSPGAYRLVEPPHAVRVPPTVQAILAARIDRLHEDDKALLQAAAVIGKDVPLPLLRSAVESSEDELRAGLGRLQRAELLYEARLFPDPEYTFKHALTHEVAYDSLLGERRRQLHAAVVERLERLHPGRLGEHIERLGHHAVRGELWDRAVDYLGQAAGKALSRSAYREAAALLEEAAAASERAEPTPEALVRAIDLRLELRGALFPLREHARQAHHLRVAEQLAARLGDPRRIAWIAVAMGHHLWISGDAAEGLRRARAAVAGIRNPGNDTLEIAANYFLGVTLLSAGFYREGSEQLAVVTGRLVGPLQSFRLAGIPGMPVVIAGSNRAWAAGELGEFAEAEALAGEARRIAEELDHPYSRVFPDWHLGYVKTVQGDAAAAIALLERARALAQERGFDLLLPLLSWCLGRALVLGGRVAEGRAMIDEAVQGQEALEFRVYHSLALAHLGEAHLAAGDLGAARAVLERALADAAARGERGHEAWTRLFLADLAAREAPGDRAATAAAYQAALDAGLACAMAPLVARARLGRDRALGRE